MPDGSDGELVWQRGKCDGGACVEVAADGEAVLVRSSANPDAPPAALSCEEWWEFLADVKQGAFDGVTRPRGPDLPAHVLLAGLRIVDRISGKGMSVRCEVGRVEHRDRELIA